MPLNRNAVIRYEFLDKKLSDKHHYYTIRDLWEQCNDYLQDQGMEPVLKRTIELDLHDLEDIPFNADIERFTYDVKNMVINHDLVNTIMSHSFNVVWLKPEKFTLGDAETSMKDIVTKVYDNYR